MYDNGSMVSRTAIFPTALATTGVFFAGVVERSWPVLELAVLVQNSSEQQDGALGAIGDPFPVSSQGVVPQHLVEIPVGPAVGGWFGQHV